MTDIVEDAKRAGFDFLAVDLGLATTFLDVAQTSTDPETRARNRSNAIKAYDTVRDLVNRVSLTPNEYLILEEKLRSLKSRLDEGSVEGQIRVTPEIL